MTHRFEVRPETLRSSYRGWDRPPLHDDRMAARAAYAELAFLGFPRVNLMLVGGDAAIDCLMDALLPELRGPVHYWRPGDPLALPPPRLITTMVFQDVGAMPQVDQQRLLEWMDQAAGRTQMVSTTSVNPLPRPDASAGLSDRLYYRLNVIRIEVGVTGARAHGP